MLTLISSILLSILVMVYVQRKRKQALQLQAVRAQHRRQVERSQRPY